MARKRISLRLWSSWVECFIPLNLPIVAGLVLRTLTFSSRAWGMSMRVGFDWAFVLLATVVVFCCPLFLKGPGVPLGTNDCDTRAYVTGVQQWIIGTRKRLLIGVTCALFLFAALNAGLGSWFFALGIVIPVLLYWGIWLASRSRFSSPKQCDGVTSSAKEHVGDIE